MKTTLFVLSFASLSLLSGCVDDSPWRITGFAVDSKCMGTLAMVDQDQGLLDVATANRQQTTYLLQVKETNELNPPVNPNANQMNLTTVQSGAITIKEAIVTYTAVPRIDMKKEAIPLGGVVPAGGGMGGFIELNIITTNAAEALVNAVAAGNTAQLSVSIQFHGVEQSGGDIYSTPAAFPIHVFNSGVTCPAPDFFGPTGICGNAGGQDGTVACCASDTKNCVVSTTTP
jgi:hypothetical protein